jgi:thioredoxin-related protein
MRKYLIFLLLFCGMFIEGGAQNGKAGAAQQDKRGIAPFKIRLVNGEGFTYQQLPKHVAVRLVYFSPTCDHCKAFAAAMLARQKTLQDKMIIMISFEDIKEVQQFDRLYKLSAHSNIKIGSEGYTFIVQRYYQVEHFPFIAEYNKNGALTRILPQEMTPEQMAAAL